MSGDGAYFFSYSRRDAAFVLGLATELRAAGADLWLDQLDIRGGQKWDEAVEEALRHCRGVLVVLSPEAVASSNVMDEVAYALEKGKHVVPLLHKPCEIPLRLRRLQYVDFTGERNKAVVELLRALEIESDARGRKGAAADRAAILEGSPTQPVGDKGSPGLHALAGFVGVGTAALVAMLLTALLPSETRGLADVFRREPEVFLFTFVLAGIPGAACGAICGRRPRLIRTALLATVAAWVVGLLFDPRYEGTMFGFVAGPALGGVLAAIQRRRSAREPR